MQVKPVRHAIGYFYAMAIVDCRITGVHNNK